MASHPYSFLSTAPLEKPYLESIRGEGETRTTKQPWLMRSAPSSCYLVCRPNYLLLRLLTTKPEAKRRILSDSSPSARTGLEFPLLRMPIGFGPQVRDEVEHGARNNVLRIQIQNAFCL